MSLPRVTYFSGRGFGEGVRLVLAETGPFEDNRVSDIAALKPVLPFGQVPLLEMPDGFKMVQSTAICRYIANKFGFSGKTPEERALADMFVDGLADLRTKIFTAIRAKEDKDNQVAQVLREVLPQWLGYFEKALQNNEAGSKFLVGDGLTYADILLFNLLDHLAHPSCFGAEKTEEALAGFPLLREHTKTIANRPNIAEYLKKRPVTQW